MVKGLWLGSPYRFKRLRLRQPPP